MKSREFVPLDGRLGRPFIESGGHVTYGERGSSNRVVVSPRKGQASKLSLQASPSCPDVIAHPGMVFVVVLIQCRGVACHDATMPVMTALLAQWWLINCPARRDLAVAFVIISCSLSGVVASAREQIAAPGSLAAFACHDTSGLDP
jgi:hypothetical protein